MGELVRFGIAIDDELLEQFDARVASKGYGNRSEAIRDLIRGDLVDAVAQSGAVVHAALTLVYDHHVRELTERLMEIQHALGESVISTMHVHIDHDHCLEVVVLRGPAERLQRAADQIVALKGVRHGRLTLTATGAPSNKPHAHAHPHEHAHLSAPRVPRSRRGRD